MQRPYAHWNSSTLHVAVITSDAGERNYVTRVTHPHTCTLKWSKNPSEQPFPINKTKNFMSFFGWHLCSTLYMQSSGLHTMSTKDLGKSRIIEEIWPKKHFLHSPPLWKFLWLWFHGWTDGWMEAQNQLTAILFIGSIFAVGVSITVPVFCNATSISAAELFIGALPLIWTHTSHAEKGWDVQMGLYCTAMNVFQSQNKVEIQLQKPIVRIGTPVPHTLQGYEGSLGRGHVSVLLDKFRCYKMDHYS